MDFIIGFIAIVLVFGLAVFVHELGHFVFARLRGISVEAFAIGMGPKIVAWQSGETEYSLRWFPVGGFVKLHQMVREEEDDSILDAGVITLETHEKHDPEQATTAEEGDEKGAIGGLGDAVHGDMVALYDQGLFTKLLVFGGGVFFNYLTAILALILLHLIGFEEPTHETRVGKIASETAVYEAGLRHGDRIVAVEGEEVAWTGEFAEQLDLAVENETIKDGLKITVDREGDRLDLTLPPVEIDPENPGPIYEGFAWEFMPYIGAVIPGKPADKAGIKEGDIFVEINGEPIRWWSDLQRIINSSPEEELHIQLERRLTPEGEVAEFDDETATVQLMEVSLTPARSVESPEDGVIGIAPGTPYHTWNEAEPFFTAVARGPGRAWTALKNILILHRDVLGASIKNSGMRGLKENVGGPIMIARITYEAAQQGFRRVLEFFIVFNLLLLIMNLLPIPVLDGGFIVLSVIEAVIRRPVPSKILTPIYTLFAIAFILLFILISFQDVMNNFVGKDNQVKQVQQATPAPAAEPTTPPNPPDE